MAGRIVLGLGGCLDSEVKLSTPVLQRLVEEHQIDADELSERRAVTSERDLVISVLGYARLGRGGEHFVASAEALQAFADRFGGRITLGGTSVRAGIAMSRLGLPATLHLVGVDDRVRRLLPSTCDYVSSGEQEALTPHVIAEYDHRLRVRVGDVEIVPPFPNRLIYVNDPANEALVLSPELGTLLRGARIFLISGFNAVRDPEVLEDRLHALRGHLRQLPSDAVTYYEDAAFHEPAFSQRVRDVLLDDIDVYGLNEDEMQVHLGRPVDLLSVPEVERALTDLRVVLPAPTLVVHTKYWSAVVGEQAEAYAEPVDAGILIASTRYRYGDDYRADQVDLLRAQPRRAAASELAAALEARTGSAVRCRAGFQLDVAEPTTVGLGDTFVGGFLAALSRSCSGTPTRGERPVTATRGGGWS